MRTRQRVWLAAVAGLLAASLVGAGPVSAGTGSLTIIKDASPADGTDFDFTVIGPGVGGAVPLFATKWTAPSARLAVNSAGDVYVTELFNDRVMVYDGDGVFKFQFGAAGTGNGQFTNASGIAVDDDDFVYVGDQTANRVQKFTAAGTYVTQWGSPGTADGQFDNLQGIAVDENFNVYTVERDGHRVQKFTDTGTFITKWGGTGTGNGQFQSPQDLSIDSAGDVYVADVTNQRVQRFTNSGAYVSQWSAGVAFGIDIGPDDSVYVSDLGAVIKINRYDTGGVFQGTWGTTGTADGQFQNAQGIAVDQNTNRVFVGDGGNNRIQRFDYPNMVTLDDAVPDDADGITSSETFTGLDAATYSIIEAVPSGWVVAGASCTGGTDSGTLTANTLAVTLGVGENVTCTVTNEPKVPATLTIVKDANPADGTNFAFTVDAATITAVNFDLDDAVPDDTDGVDASNVISGLDPDTFTISEVVPANWNLDSAVCSGGSDAGTLAGSDLTVFIGNGDNVTCTFTNTRTTAELTVIKDSNPADGTDFAFVVDSPSISPINFDLDDAVPDDADGVSESNTMAGLAPGTFTITESVPPDWGLTSAACVGGADSGSLSGSVLTVALAAGENVVCTVTNTATTGQLIIAKQAKPDIGTNFDLTLAAPDVFYDYAFGGVYIANGANLASDGNGHVWLSSGFGRLHKFTDDGTHLFFVTAPPQGATTSLQGLDVDSSGNVWVTDSWNDRVMKFDSAGTFIAQYGVSGSADGELNTPYDVAVDSTGNIFVSQFAGKVQKFDSSFNYLAKATGGNLGGVKVDSTDDVFVVDTSSRMVTRYDNSLILETQWGGIGSGPTEFQGPVAIAIDPSGDAYVADVGLDVVKRFDRDGNYKSQFGSGTGTWNYPSGLAVDNFGNVFVADADIATKEIQRHSALAQFKLDDSRVDDADGIPNSRTFTVKPGIFVVDETLLAPWLNESLSCIGGADAGTAVGTQMTIAVAAGESVVCTYTNRKPGSLTVVKDASIDDGTDFSFSANGTGIDRDYVEELSWGGFGSTDGKFQNISAVDVGASGNIYVGDANRDIVQWFDADGNFLGKFGSSGTGDGQFTIISGVAVDGSGNVFVADRVADRIQKFDSSGAYVGKVGTTGTALGQFDTPRQLAVDSSGNLFVADERNYRVQKFSNTLVPITEWGSSGNADGQFDNPYGIGVADNGDVLVTDNHFSGRTQRFTNSGVFISKFNQSSSTYDVDFDGGGSIYSAPQSSSWRKLTSAGAPVFDSGSTTVRSIAVNRTTSDVYVGTSQYTVKRFAGGLDFVLDDALPDDNDGINNSIELHPINSSGQFEITEGGQFGWELESVTCSGGVDAGTLNGSTLSVNVAAGEDVTCTFNNERINALTVVSPQCVAYDSVTSGDGALTPGVPRVIQVTGAAACVPVGASAAVLTVTAKNPAGFGNLRVSESGVVPAGGVVNYINNGLDNSNTITVPLSASGAVDVAANIGAADVRISVTGYYSLSGTLEYFPVTPCAFGDSRPAQGATGVLAGPFTSASFRWSYRVTGDFNLFGANQGGGNTNCGIPGGAAAVMVNVVAIDPTLASGGVGIAPGFDVGTEPVANYAPIGLNNSAVAIVPVVSNGVKVTTIGGGSAHNRLVVLGYFNPVSGDKYTPVNPCAAFDSRDTLVGDSNPPLGVFAGKRVAGTSGVNLTGVTSYNVTGAVPSDQGGELACGIPEGAKAVLINLVAILPESFGNFRAFASGSSPTGGVLNFNSLTPAMNNSNAVVVPLSAAGNMDIFVNAPGNDGNQTVHARGVILGYYD